MNDTTTTSGPAEHTRERYIECLDQIDITKGILGLLKRRADQVLDHGAGLDWGETMELFGALNGAYEAAEKARDNLSELDDLVPDYPRVDPKEGAQ